MKNKEAAERTTLALVKIGREYFTELGYYKASLEKIAEEGNVTRGAVYHHFKSKKGLFLAVLDAVQKDVAMQIENEAEKSDDLWQQLILGCQGFIRAANTRSCRRILLIDAPAVVGWDTWREMDQKNSMSVLQAHIEELKQGAYLLPSVDTKLMTYCLSGALNELALNDSHNEDRTADQAIYSTIVHLVSGFKRASSEE